MGTSSVPDLSLGTTCVEFLKKAKKVKKADGDDTQLSATVWERLPESLIEEVLTKLPFSSLFQFCCVCKSWRDVILSAVPHLTYFQAGKLLALNPRRNVWESVSLSFLPTDPFSLCFVASAGGLLCFRTKFEDSTSTISHGSDFIVCNPLTRTFRNVKMPRGEAPGLLDPVYVASTLRRFHRSKSSIRFFLVAMIVDLDERHFKIIVTSRVSCGERTLIYSSCSDSWEEVDGVPEVGGGCFLEAQPIVCRGNLYGSIRTTNDELKLVKFDMQQKKWSRIQVPQMRNSPWKLLEHAGKILLVSGNPRNPAEFAFHELNDSGFASWSPSKSLHMVRLLEAMGRRSTISGNLKVIDCLGEGDSLFCIGSKSSTSKASPLGSSKRSFTLGIHQFSNSNLLADWEELQPGAYQPFPRVWQIFRPSLLPCIRLLR